MAKLIFNSKLQRKYLSSPKQKKSCICEKEKKEVKANFIELGNGYVKIVFDNEKDVKNNK